MLQLIVYSFACRCMTLDSSWCGDPAWDLEMELLIMPCTGDSVARMGRLASKIDRACSDVPQHVKEIGLIVGGNNPERDLHRWVHRQQWRQLLPELYNFEIAWTQDGVHEEIREIACYLPHETVASMAAFPKIFDKLVCPPTETNSFWENEQIRSKWFEKHPLREEIMRDPTKAFPIGIHGDDAGAFQREKVLVLTWNAVAVSLTTLDSRILFIALSLLHTVANKTLPMVYRVLAWSINALQMGVHPYEDHLGQLFSKSHHPRRFAKRGMPLTAQNHRGVFSELRGDWKWQWESLMLEQFFNATRCCHLCRANKKIRRLMYTQFSRDAHLRKTHISFAKFRDSLAAEPEQRSWLTTIIGFTTWRCWVDCMHALDLGVYQIICACALVELVDEKVWPAATKAISFTYAHSDYKQFCKEHKLQPAPVFHRKKLRETGTDCPTFTAFQAKANQVKYILLWLAQVLSRPGISGEWRKTMFFHFAEFENICSSHGPFLPPDAAEAIARHIEGAFLCYNALSARSLRNRSYMWSISPKAHMVTHMAYDFVIETLRNPRTTTCYADEDMVGKMKVIVEACHGKTAPQMAMRRYAILVGVRWWTHLLAIQFAAP